jgi:biotin carboxyl carrier protein
MPNPERVEVLQRLLAFLGACSLLMILMSGCTNPHAAESGDQKIAPATVRNAPKEAELATITLTPRAEQRLGISVAALSFQRVVRTRTFGATVVLPPDRRTAVIAPIGGTLIDSRSGVTAGTAVRKGQTTSGCRNW